MVVRRAGVGNMALKVLTLEMCFTLVGTWDGEEGTHRPVLVENIVIVGLVVVTVVTAKRTLLTVYVLMSWDLTALAHLSTIDAFNLGELTSI